MNISYHNYSDQNYHVISIITVRAVTVADFDHRCGNGPTTAGGTVFCVYIYIYIYIYI